MARLCDDCPIKISCDIEDFKNSLREFGESINEPKPDFDDLVYCRDREEHEKAG